MTAALLDRASTRLPANRQTRRPTGPKLRVLDQAANRRRARHRSALLILFVAVLAGFFAVAFVHAELVAGQHDLDAVRAEISQAEARHAELARSVEAASAPAEIVTRATELGMVRARQPLYLTTAAPIRSIEVGSPLLAPATPSATVSVGDGGSIDRVAAPGTDTGAPGDGLRGTIGQPGGLTAGTQIEPTQDTPVVALGTPASPAGASTAANPNDGAQPAATTATTPPDPTSGPTSSIAGASAASAPVAGSALPSVAGSAPVSVAGSAPAPVAGSVVAPASGSNPAGGLASAAATTSG